MELSNLTDFVCPQCRKQLDIREEGLHCDICQALWPTVDGVPSFTGNDIYWNELPRDEMNKFLDVAEKKGWNTAIYDHLELRDKRNYNIVGDERRADWKFLVPLTKDSVVMDLGSGWGANAVALSEVCGRVYAVDATWERVRFLNIRKKQQNIDNLFPVHGGDRLMFPFPDDYFDLISMVGVLEWIGTWYSDLKPRDAQLKALRMINKLLRRGGCLYIGIENRFGYNYLMGGRDHNRLRFVSLLPRFLSNIISKKFAGEPYTTYQYSMYGYKRMLREAGFSEMQFYAPLPQYRSPIYYIPLDNVNSMEYFLKYMFGKFEMTSPDARKYYAVQYKVAKVGVKIALLLRLTGLARFIVPGFSIIARK
jgi:SAM-dependent methyltransferase